MAGIFDESEVHLVDCLLIKAEVVNPTRISRLPAVTANGGVIGAEEYPGYPPDKYQLVGLCPLSWGKSQALALFDQVKPTSNRQLAVFGFSDIAMLLSNCKLSEFVGGKLAMSE
jgi:hypothetical protein